jgi:hypothetical protein
MARKLQAPDPYVANHRLSEDMMMQPTTFDSVLATGCSMDTVGEGNLVPPADYQPDGLADKPEC